MLLHLQEYYFSSQCKIQGYFASHLFSGALSSGNEQCHCILGSDTELAFVDFSYKLLTFVNMEVYKRCIYSNEDATSEQWRHGQPG